MEALKKLEEVQRMVSFVTSSGLASDNPDSDGFLAHFLLFLVQTSGMLDIEKRCHLISKHLSKISPAFLEEARVCITAEDSQQNPAMCPILQLHPDNKRDIFPLRTNEKDMAMIGLDSMQRANSTLEDFCRSYFMFHGMDVNEPQTLFRFLPVLSFTESYIYQLDSFNEEILCSLMECSSLEKDPDFVDGTYRDEGNERLSNNILDAFKTDPLRPLVVLLEHHGLLTDGLRTELSSGAEYWALERKLCHALISKKEAATTDTRPTVSPCDLSTENFIFGIPIEDVMRAIHLKSFDYRVLNLLLYQLREQPVNDLHMEFLSISEFLVEVSDDLYDYEDDVVENSFNILRMFVRLYGASMAPSMLAKCISEAEEKYEHLLKALDPELSLKYIRRCEEATKEGGKVSGHKLGTWNMPPVIADEEAYRSHILKLKSNDSARLD